MFESYYCEKLEKTLHFLPDGVKFCCSCAEGAGIKISDFSKFNKEDIIKAKKKYVEFLRKGQLPKECSGCIEYKKRSIKQRIKEFFEKPVETKISHIIVDHFKQCDCNCSYCSQTKFFPSRTQNYELLPIIQALYEQKMIDLENLKVEFQGGNISELKEFDQLMKEFYAHNCDDFVILMNAIKYIPILEKIGNNWKSHICISLDAGTRETFKKIKNIDAFDQVIDNIKKLKQKSSAQISLKYIIINGVNDNKEELEKFLNIAKEIGNIQPVHLEIDYNNTLLSKGIKFEVPKHYYELFKIAENYCKENDLGYKVFPYTQHILDQGYSI